jgi:hypothetical protein
MNPKTPELVIHKPVTYEIHPDKNGNPYLKRVERRRNIQEEGRGKWVSIGRDTDLGIEKVIRINEQVGGLICLPDETGTWRALVLTD